MRLPGVSASLATLPGGNLITPTRIVLLLLATLSAGIPRIALAAQAGQAPDSSVQQQAAAASQDPPPERTTEEILERHFVINFIDDQKAIWTSPLRLKKKDLFWLVPSAALIGESLHRDAYMYRKLTPTVNPGNTSKTFSDAGVLAMGGGIAGMYLLGRLHGNDHQRETAVLATEALTNAMTVGYALKFALQRDRPFNTGRGDFFTPGGGTSFPSGHALAAWSMASVVAHEYPGVLTQIGAYGLATAVSVTRVTGRQHFPTDVLVGSALGWGIGELTYRRHHDENLPGSDIDASESDKSPIPEQEYGNVYLSLDSWIYPVLDRLSSLGYIDSSFSGQRPWTRAECARLLNEAQNEASDTTSIQPLVQEALAYLSVGSESNGYSVKPHVESIYFRATSISGPPLGDGYHFGQTIYNDFGRPYREGFNSIAGSSGWFSYGSLSVFVSGEYQHAPSADAPSQAVLNEISFLDGTPAGTSGPISALNRLRFQDSYVAWNFAKGWALVGGKQSLWWGPGVSGPLSFSDNPEPIGMVRLTREIPLVLPGLLRYLGPLRGEFFVGQLAGQHFTRTVKGTFGPELGRQPLIDGEKISFKPTPNFEFGVSVTTLFGGSGAVLNARAFLRTFSLKNTNPGELADPGDRRAGFDFRYRIPFLRDRLTVYNDSFTEDEVSPIGYPRRSAMNPGIYLARVPYLPKLDIRAEGYYTDLPGLRPIGSYYYNARFLSGYTNQGDLIGNTVGRQGSGFIVKSTYWFSGQKSFEVGHRRNQISPEFLTNGGSLRDYWGKADWTYKEFTFSAKLQYEKWKIPVLAVGEQNNFTSMIQVTFHPSFSSLP